MHVYRSRRPWWASCTTLHSVRGEVCRAGITCDSNRSSHAARCKRVACAMGACCLVISALVLVLRCCCPYCTTRAFAPARAVLYGMVLYRIVARSLPRNCYTVQRVHRDASMGVSEVGMVAAWNGREGASQKRGRYGAPRRRLCRGGGNEEHYLPNVATTRVVCVCVSMCVCVCVCVWERRWDSRCKRCK